jgi:hypothetical protein
MHDQLNERPPAPELSPEQMLRAVEFELLPGAFEEAEAEA